MRALDRTVRDTLEARLRKVVDLQARSLRGERGSSLSQSHQRGGQRTPDEGDASSAASSRTSSAGAAYRTWKREPAWAARGSSRGCSTRCRAATSLLGNGSGSQGGCMVHNFPATDFFDEAPAAGREHRGRGWLSATLVAA
ncbi:hypothetical protein ACTMU2_11905 [Cupriavidus basilensis]